MDLGRAILGYASENIPGQWSISVVPHTDVIMIGACIPYQGKEQFVKEAFFIGDTYP